ncbi:ABC transporter substrate-binding protein [Nanoarchaeota archaeon]
MTGKSTQDLTPVEIGYKTHLLYLPAYVAQANKYFEQEGLDVELVKFESTNHLVEAILTGRIDAGIGGINALVPLTIEGKSPGSLKIFNLGILTDSFDYLLVRKDSEIRSVKDLAGKTISAHPGSSVLLFIQLMIDKERLQDVTIVQTAPAQQLSALSSGSIDAIFVLEPLATIGITSGEARILIQSPISTYFRQEDVEELESSGSVVDLSNLKIRFICMPDTI